MISSIWGYPNNAHTHAKNMKWFNMKNLNEYHGCYLPMCLKIFMMHAKTYMS